MPNILAYALFFLALGFRGWFRRFWLLRLSVLFNLFPFLLNRVAFKFLVYLGIFFEMFFLL